MQDAELRDLILDDRSRGVFRINRRAFTDAEILSREQREIFGHVWLYLAHESELAQRNSFIARTVAGRPIILTRDGEGALHALFNACTHRGNVLCREKRGDARKFTCNYHAWTYSLAGDLVAQPGQDAYSAAAQDRKDLGLARVPRLDAYRGFIFVSFDPNVVDLVEYLAGAREQIDFFLAICGDDVEVPPGDQIYSMNANWKLLVENSFDGYHVLPTHNRYFQQYLSDMGAPAGPMAGSGDVIGRFGRGLALGNGHAAVVTPTLGNPLEASAQKELDEIRARLTERYGAKEGARIASSSINLLIYPNTFLISLWRSIRTFYPRQPDLVEINAWGLMPRADSPELRQKRMENFISFLGPGGFATPDDMTMLERCQQGFSATGLHPGWSDVSRGMNWDDPGVNEELQMRAFWRQWRHMIEGRRGPADCADRADAHLAAE